MRTTIPFLLASASPRRRHLLEILGLPFSVMTASVSEDVETEWTPAEIVQNLAIRKAASVADEYPDALVLGADTLVVVGDEILGKPVNESEAVRMLEMLSARTHQVFTGLALVSRASDRSTVGHEVTDVTFAELDPAQIRAYVASGSPMDKAGAYGIQEDLGATFVSGIRGDYYTVVGLPLHRLYKMLTSEFGDLMELDPAPNPNL